MKKITILIAKAIKKYAGVETVTYKKWWKLHTKYMQKILDREHNVIHIND